MPVVTALFDALWSIVVEQGPWLLAFAISFTALSTLSEHACNPGKVWWRNPGLMTDLIFCVFSQVTGRYLQMFVLLLIGVWVVGLEPDGIDAYISNGSGPLSKSPLWIQLAVYLLGTDFFLYWSHRLFHSRVLWPFHAVHHSPEQLDWTATFRNHPVNRLFTFTFATCTMLMLGIPPWLMVALTPLDMISAAWVHANLNWTLGPLKYVFATPVFHRWHHTGVDEGGSSNFAPTFSIWDVLFGTFYMPEGKLPENYGVDDPNFPKTFVGLLIVPFEQFVRGLIPHPSPAVIEAGGPPVQRVGGGSERI